MPLGMRSAALTQALMDQLGADVVGRAQIEELAALGVRPPGQTPLFYLVSPDRLTQRDVVTVVGTNTSGEAEPVLVWQSDGICMGIGSDHTDRDSERCGVAIAIAKQLCPKVVGRDFWFL